MNPFEGYRITSPFGWRRNPFDHNGKEWHQGIDLVKKHEAPIKAFVPGTVRFAALGAKGSGFGGYGNVVAVEDKYKCLHVYAHLEKVNVKVGDNVKAGDTVGLQGSTGRSTASHLHYEVRKKAAPQYGYSTDKQNYCYEPIEYLVKYAAGEKREEDRVPKAVSWSYTVKAGDTLSEIAKDNKTTVEAILKLNPTIKDPAKISIGQKIKLG